MIELEVGRAYGRIPHLPGSTMASDDVAAGRELAELCLSTAPMVTIEEKLDGSCVSVWRTATSLVATGRSGAVCSESNMVHHRLFGLWVETIRDRLERLLNPGERVVGEWLALAHGTRYALDHEPFVPFEIFTTSGAADAASRDRLVSNGFTAPRLIHEGTPISLAQVVDLLEPSGHGALDPVEGAVWKVRRPDGGIERAKFVRPMRVAGSYLPGNGRPPIWNWRPNEEWIWAAAGGYSGQG